MGKKPLLTRSVSKGSASLDGVRIKVFLKLASSLGLAPIVLQEKECGFNNEAGTGLFRPPLVV